MSDQEINIAIAEACGWTFNPPPYNKPPFSVAFKAEALLCWTRPGNMPHQLAAPPDYCNDLNAMHEAEKVLLSGYWLRYCECLTYLLGKSVYASVHARARNRAEAFLRTLGKWEEAK